MVQSELVPSFGDTVAKIKEGQRRQAGDGASADSHAAMK
jgi:hypothetical protein